MGAAVVTALTCFLARLTEEASVMEAQTRTPNKRRAAFIFSSGGFQLYLKYLNLEKKVTNTALTPNLLSI